MKIKYEISFGWKGFEFADREERVCDWAFNIPEAFEKIDKSISRHLFHNDETPRTWTITEIKGQAIIASGAIIKQQGGDYYAILTERHQIAREAK